MDPQKDTNPTIPMKKVAEGFRKIKNDAEKQNGLNVLFSCDAEIE